MFGFYRTMLAIWVMVFNLLDVPIIGTYAVFSFFALSGFLMTTIMHDSYGHNLQGVMRYAENRFLRLYPTYWAAAVFSIAVIVFASTSYSVAYKDSLFIPDTFYSIIYKESLNNVIISYNRTSISKNSALKFQDEAAFA